MIPDTLRALAHTWLAPISEGSPAGDDAAADERYLDLRAEVARLERGDRVDWARVLDLGTELLQETTKDLLVACHIAWALFERSGVVGLTQGVALVAALLDTYGDALHPRRPRARAGALEWLLQTRCEPALAGLRPGTVDAQELSNLLSVVRQLQPVVTATLGDHAPSTAGVVAAIEHLRGDGEPIPSAPPVIAPPRNVLAPPVIVPPLAPPRVEVVEVPDAPEPPSSSTERPAPLAPAAPAAPVDPVVFAFDCIGRGAAHEAIGPLRDALAQTTTSPQRMRILLALGRVCLEARLPRVAIAAFEQTEALVARHELESWEPALALESALGMLSCARVLGRDQLIDPLFSRVSRLDPVLASRL
ncbi:MAG: TssA family type VI secretion system protein [Polyangiales bacterium]